LLKRIWSKLSGKPRIEAVKTTLDQTAKMTPEQVNQIAAYLQVAMDDDPNFARDLQMLAQEINAGKLVDQSTMTQINSDNAKAGKPRSKVAPPTSAISPSRTRHPRLRSLVGWAPPTTPFGVPPAQPKAPHV
jgi:hypothetical protein